MEHRSAQAKQELIVQEFLEKHHFDPPAAILPQLRIVTQKERDTLLKKRGPDPCCLHYPGRSVHRQ